MARWNQTRKRTQRYLLTGKARRLIRDGVRPLIDVKGRRYFVIGGRSYTLPAGFLAE